MCKLTAIAMLLAISLNVKAQDKQGSITYSMKMENSPLAAIAGDMQIKLYYKGVKSLTDMSAAVYSVKTLVTDTGALTLMDAMGQKYYIKTKALPADSIKGAMPTVNYVNEYKQIAGYNCQKALVTFKVNTNVDTAVFWITEKLPIVSFGKEAALFKGLKGMALEYSISMAGINMTVTALSVSDAPVPDSIFQLSTEGYSEMDGANMLKQMQQ